MNHTIVRNASGHRAVKLTSGEIIPAEVARQCVGKDLWLSQIQCKCRDCKQPFQLSELHGGGQWCEECQMGVIKN